MYWRNSNFQIAYFLAGKCHTIDAAYKMLCELREERDVAIRSARASALRAEAKKRRATMTIAENKDEVAVLEAKADIAEIDALGDQTQGVYEQGLRERDFIDACIAKIQPLRKYKHLPDHEAHQACQQEEWKLELIHRAKTFLLTSGSIPQDQLSTMMCHPEFKSSIAPQIDMLMKSGNITLSQMDSSPVAAIVMENFIPEKNEMVTDKAMGWKVII